jgi:hypothetical protein
MNSLAASSIAARARQIHCTGGFDLECDADTAFPFFSPEGERKWITGWNPQPVFPEQIVFDRDTVFREGTPEATWTIVDVDWHTHRAEYVRFAPTSHSAHVIVKVEAPELSCSQVVVSYTVTVFGENATALLDAFSESAYAAKMQDWKRRVTAVLATR